MSVGFTLKIEGDLAQDLAFRAALLGTTREELALQLLQPPPFNYDDYEWYGEDPRTAILEADAADDKDARPWEEVKADLIEHMEELIRGRQTKPS